MTRVLPTHRDVWWALPATGATTRQLTESLGLDAVTSNTYTTRVNLRLRQLERDGCVRRYMKWNHSGELLTWPLNPKGGN